MGVGNLSITIIGASMTRKLTPIGIVEFSPSAISVSRERRQSSPTEILPTRQSFRLDDDENSLAYTCTDTCLKFVYRQCGMRHACDRGVSRVSDDCHYQVSTLVVIHPVLAGGMFSSLFTAP